MCEQVHQYHIDNGDATRQAMQDLLRLWNTVEHPRSWIYRAVQGRLRRAAVRFQRKPVHDGIAGACDNGTARSPWDGSPMHHQDLGAFGGEERRVLDLLRQLPPEQRRVMA
ncbi:hypothetical protein LI90_1969 [Carbonactinospora thermoautotrophica]|uniref:RNA polymerase sigma-70 region 2 domain-containing protein n=1 Tax=Carbonactinospora thermoautotrophica TaxID=1469144 RepID=A0A132MHA8_9ACTN|nr:hypothetical protein [Carbonactinospora thermoautotrophica]KWW97224.1 hypothetical protein LI90_4449 [Carbonactinospora thermoautotrophica]KWX00941.1 hypothetical protein LI90_1969 [Carbonactinospora thermoautotrophica]